MGFYWADRYGVYGVFSNFFSRCAAKKGICNAQTSPNMVPESINTLQTLIHTLRCAGACSNQSLPSIFQAPRTIITKSPSSHRAPFLTSVALERAARRSPQDEFLTMTMIIAVLATISQGNPCCLRLFTTASQPRAALPMRRVCRSSERREKKNEKQKNGLVWFDS